MSKEARSSRCEVRTTTTLVRNVSPSGHKTLNEYRILAELGRGCHGKVKLAQDTKTQSLWALKVVPRLERRVNKLQSSTDGHLRAIRREIAILKKCVHTHVVRLREVIDDPQAEKIYMVLEYCEGGDIVWHKDSAPVLSIMQAKHIFKHVILGSGKLTIRYILYNYQGIVHRDIKPANLLWAADNIVKISDFGVSVFVGKPKPSLTGSQKSSESLSSVEQDLAKTAGSPAFFAPELCAAGDTISIRSSNSSESSVIESQNHIVHIPILPNSHNHVIHTSPLVSQDYFTQKLPSARTSIVLQNSLKKSSAFSRISTNISPTSIIPAGAHLDIWAMGVTLYCLVYGKVPFIAESEFELFQMISRKEITYPESPQIPSDLLDLFQGILCKDQNTRLTLEQIRVPHLLTKTHPWFMDKDGDDWMNSSDPLKNELLYVTEDEVREGIKTNSFFRQTLKGITRSISSLVGVFSKRSTWNSQSSLGATRIDESTESNGADLVAPKFGGSEGVFENDCGGVDLVERENERMRNWGYEVARNADSNIDEQDVALGEGASRSAVFEV